MPICPFFCRKASYYICRIGVSLPRSNYKYICRPCMHLPSSHYISVLGETLTSSPYKCRTRVTLSSCRNISRLTLSGCTFICLPGVSLPCCHYISRLGVSFPLYLDKACLTRTYTHVHFVCMMRVHL